MVAGGLEHVECVRWTDQAKKVESSREPFMAPLGHVTCMDIGGKGKEGRNILGCPVRGACRCCVVNSMSVFFVECKRVGHSPLSREGSKEGCNCIRCDGCNVGGSGKET